jgi:hypothetical protein
MLDKVCIHTFLTPGFMGWGELFLEALRRIHGERIHVRIDSRNLSDEDIELLHRIYGNIEIHNRPLDWQALADEAGVSLETFHQWRVEIERGVSTQDNHLFRIAISVNERYCTLPQVMEELRAQGYEIMLHSDADIYIRRPLDRLFEILSEHDLSLFIRPKNPHWMGVVGGFLGFRLNNQTKKFMSQWMEQIDSVPLIKRWNGFGQSTLLFAIEASTDTKIADLMKIPGAPRLTKLFEPEKELWLGNAKVKGPVKVISIQKCWEDLLGRYPRIPLPGYSIGERINAEIKAAWIEIKEILKKILKP